MHTNTHVYHPGNTWLPYSTRSNQLCILTANTQIIIYSVITAYIIQHKKEYIIITKKKRINMYAFLKYYKKDL